MGSQDRAGGSRKGSLLPRGSSQDSGAAQCWNFLWIPQGRPDGNSTNINQEHSCKQGRRDSDLRIKPSTPKSKVLWRVHEAMEDACLRGELDSQINCYRFCRVTAFRCDPVCPALIPFALSFQNLDNASQGLRCILKPQNKMTTASSSCVLATCHTHADASRECSAVLRALQPGLSALVRVCNLSYFGG